MHKFTSTIFFLFVFFFSGTSFSQVTTLAEDFSTCTGSLPSGWTKYSVSGTDSWSCTSFAYSGQGVMMSGYSGGNNNTNEDWLISPLLNFSTYTAPSLSFWCRTKYSGPFIQVMVSNNYAGTGNPNAATWNALPAVLPTSNSDVWFYEGPLSLNAYKNQNMHIAFRYTSTTAAAATWRIDNVNVMDGTLTLPNRFVNAGECAAGYSSAGATFNFTMSSLQGNFVLDAPAPFEISKDGLSYSSSLTYTSTASGAAQTVHVRVSPSVANKVYRRELTFTYNGVTMGEKVKLLGTSLSDDKTLRVFNWNMRWFGDPSMCSCDTNLAKNNAIRLVRDIDADVYCLQEVVSINQLEQIKNALGPNYAYAISGFCSGVTSPSSGFYTTCQKLAFIYNTQKIENLGTHGLLSSTYPSDTSAYYCFTSGRFPFVLKARLKLANSTYDTVMITTIHSKAGTTLTDYNRRKCAAEKMTDSLNALYGAYKVIVAGDFNDYLEGSSVTGQVNSPFQYALNNGFTGVTLPSKFPGQSTFVGSTDHIIDNVILNASMASRYVDSSCFIFTEPEYYIDSYNPTTTDHFGIMSYYQFNFPNGITESMPNAVHHVSIQNPSHGELNLRIHNYTGNAQVRITDLSGKLLWSKKVSVQGGAYYHESLNLPQGIYMLTASWNGRSETIKWLIQD